MIIALLQSLASGWGGQYSLRCQPVDYSRSPMAMRMARGCWWYYFSKFTEFMDTIFFVLRKKYNHISTLHVIHHGCMPMSVWFGVKFTPGNLKFANTSCMKMLYDFTQILHEKSMEGNFIENLRKSIVFFK